MASAMILAAGLGTRLRPLTDELPKPLLPIGDRPSIVAIAEGLRAQGLAPIVANTHHLADAFANLANLTITVEHDILGTAGGVANARSHLGSGRVVVWNGDIVADFAISEFDRVRAPIAWVVAPRARGAGTVGVDARDRVVRVRDLVVGDEIAGGDFMGISALDAAVVAGLPARGCLVGDVAMPHLRAGGDIAAVRFDGPWDDVGTPASYLAANLRWLGDRKSYSGVGAAIADGVTLDHAIVGAGARVVGHGSLRHVVVWPGAIAPAPLERAIVTPRGVVVVTGA